MKKNLFIIAALAIGFVSLQSCDDDDDFKVGVSESIEQALDKMYPGVTKVDWEKKYNHYVADFYFNGVEVDVWFSGDATWKMTETDVRGVEGLPEAVRVAFEGSNYSTWRVDDIDKYERPDGTFYLIEIEKKGEKDRNLYYNPDGTIIKDVEDAPNDDIRPDTKL